MDYHMQKIDISTDRFPYAYVTWDCIERVHPPFYRFWVHHGNNEPFPWQNREAPHFPDGKGQRSVEEVIKDAKTFLQKRTELWLQDLATPAPLVSGEQGLVSGR